MAGKHEQVRDEGGAREDGPAPVAGEYVDSEIPGEPRHTDEEPVGEYVGSDIPGEPRVGEADRPEREGQYEDSDIPGEPRVRTDEAEGAYDDSDIPQDR